MNGYAFMAMYVWLCIYGYVSMTTHGYVCLAMYAWQYMAMYGYVCICIVI